MFGEKNSLLNIAQITSPLFSQVARWFGTLLQEMKSVGRRWLLLASVFKQRITQYDLFKRVNSKHLTGFIEYFDVVLWTFEYPSWRVNYVSPSIEKLYGHQARNFQCDPHLWLECIHPADRQRVVAISRKITEIESQTCQYRILRPDGEVRWFRYQMRFIPSSQAHGGLVNAVGSDITIQKLLEESLRISNRSLMATHKCEAVIAESEDENSMLQGICSVVSAAGYPMAWIGILSDDNSGSIIPIGLSEEHQSYLELIKPHLRAGGTGTIAISQALRTLRPAVINYFNRELEKTPWREDAIQRGFQSKIALPLSRNDMLIGVLNVYATEQDAFNAEETKLLVALAQRIGLALQSYRNRRALHHLAYHDALTGLPNRAMLLTRLDQAIRQAAAHSIAIWVIFVDLDHFKSVNDSLGHMVGDALLSTIAKRLLSIVREADTVARLGGDEFVLILHDRIEGRPKLSADTLQRIMNTVTQPVTINEHRLHLTASMGVAIYPADGATPEELVTHADIAMYRAKEIGRNNFQFFTPEMNERALHRLCLEADMRDALRRDEFVLHYQPQVDLRTGHIVGMEALIRWRHPKHGMLPPNRFIGLSEETGLIVPIGEWVLRTACAQNKAWQVAGLGKLRVAVNLSSLQFAQQDLAQLIESILEETGLEPQYLEIELTESVVMTDVDKAIEIMNDLKDIGIELALDDFGTGYSSLAYLKQFPLDVLKIDRSFINDITHDDDAAAIVASIVSLAHNLKLHVIAEGIETREQLLHMRHYRCEMMQGYFFSKPLPASEFEDLLLKNSNLSTELNQAAA